MRIENKIETRNGPREGSSEKRKKGRVVSTKFIHYSLKCQPIFKKKNDKMTTKRISSGTSPQIQKKYGSSVPKLRRNPSKVGYLKEYKFEGKIDNNGRQLNQNKIDVSKD